YWETPASATITIIFVVIFLLVNLFNVVSRRNS
ncbi:MAG: metal ABC transporter permease, partial [Streptococcus infantarius]